MELTQDDYRFSTIDLNDYLREYTSQEEDAESSKHDIQLFQNAIEFRHVKLRECMLPRTEIEAVKNTDSIENAISLFEETKHSKLLVYENNIDNIIGYIHSYDAFKKTSKY